MLSQTVVSVGVDRTRASQTGAGCKELQLWAGQDYHRAGLHQWTLLAAEATL
jgi:hypothetical protein